MRKKINNNLIKNKRERNNEVKKNNVKPCERDIISHIKLKWTAASHWDTKSLKQLFYKKNI